ncbi:MAG: hypothetical protein NC299_16845 [Lachnospiraceae bacterium]|nr:hypothetical protein [Ruminococcus sp.]MCM1277002.1 hypothetical protein [Lachnospiraceae bacterium]
MATITTQDNSKEMKKPQEILAEELSVREYGEAVTHSEIERITGVSKEFEKNKYNQIVQAARVILLREYGRKLENIRNVGYRLVKPGDYVKSALGHYKRSATEMKKGKETLDYAPVNDMTSDERITFNRVYDQSVILQASIEGAMVQLKILGKKSHPLLDCVHNDEEYFRNVNKDKDKGESKEDCRNEHKNMPNIPNENNDNSCNDRV